MWCRGALAALGLPPQEARIALPGARGREYERGQAIFREGDPGDALHVVVRGRVATTVSGADGSSLTLAIHGPGELLGEVAALDRPAAHSTTARALQRTETLLVPWAELAALRRAHPAVSDVLLGLVAARAERLGVRLYGAHFVSAETRVLRRLAELAAAWAPDRCSPVLPLTQEELGSLAGASRATVNRVLREEEARGTAQLGRGRVRVVRCADLSRRAGFSAPGAA